MYIKYYIDFSDFEGWSGGRETLDHLTYEEKSILGQRIVQDFDVSEDSPIDKTWLNDLLWFDREYVANVLGYDSEDEFVEDRW